MKKLLAVIDFQKDFVNGALGFEGAEKLDEKISEKIEEYLKDKNDIIFTFDTHYENYPETMEGKNLPVPHCIKGKEGFKLFGKTGKYLSCAEKVFEKPTFGSIEFGKWLEGKDYQSIELVGLVSNICVVSNAVIAKASLPESEIIVDASCTDSYDKELHKKVLDVMEGMQIKVINRNN